MWQQWVNGVLGLWLILSAFIGFTPSAMTTNLVIVGIVVAILGFWGATVTNQAMRRDEKTHMRA